MRSGCIVSAALVTLLGVGSPAVQHANAQPACPAKPADPAVAKGLAQTYWRYAQKFFDQKLYAEAMKAWLCSHQMVPHPLSLYNIAKSAEQAGHFRDAIKYYRAYLEARPNAPERDRIEQSIRSFKARYGLHETKDPSIDRRPRAVQPRIGTEQTDETLTTGSSRMSKRRRSTLEITGWTAVGLGSATVVLGAVLGGLAIKAKKDFDNAPEGSWWLGDVARSAADYDRYSAGAWVGMSVGAALVAGGVVLLVLDRRRTKNERLTITPTLSPDGALVTIGGRF